MPDVSIHFLGELVWKRVEELWVLSVSKTDIEYKDELHWSEWLEAQNMFIYT